MAEKIGFVGLGIMGKPMARNLLQAGYEVVVYDLVPNPVQELAADGAKAGMSPADTAGQADILITMVQDGPQAEEAVLGASGVLEGAAAGALVIDMSSIAPGVSQKLGAACAEKGVGFLDAPVSGGEPGAIKGELAIMVGGSEAHFSRAAPVFEVLGKSAVLCGGVGAGNVTKLANQICVGANVHALAEALTLATKAGVDPAAVLDAIKGGLAGSNVLNAKGPMMVGRNFDPGFRIELHYKDINNAMATARELNVPLQVTANLQQVLGALVQSGDGANDHAAILKYVERLSGVEVKGG
jgi:2-hydroxy-3-oxopropionate reductase